jgi:adenosine deaminase
MPDRLVTDEDFIRAMPKCELHVHLEGTFEPSLRRRLAAGHGLAGGSDGGEGQGRQPATFAGLAAFLADYYEAMSVLLDEDDFYQLTAAYLGRARSEGVVHAEMFFDPQAHTSRGVPFEAVVRGIHRAQEDALAAGGPHTELIMCFLRDHSADSAAKTLEASLPYREWILGVGLDSDERGNPPAKFADVFARARAEGFRVTMHCDPDQEDALLHLRQCLDVIGVERIDHGVNCLDDEELCRLIGDRRLGLTVCPLSNLRLYGDLKADAVAEMLRRGLLVTINSDDPAYFGGYLNDNLVAVREALGLSRDQVGRLVRNGFEVAWLEPAARRRFLHQLDDYLATAGA